MDIIEGKEKRNKLIVQEKSACDEEIMGKKETILEWYRKNHKFIDAPCGGRGECGRCKIQFISNAPKATEQEMNRLSEEERKQGIRLACMTEKTGQISESDFRWLGNEVLEGDKVQKDRGCKKGDEQKKEFALAIDIGTTTLVMRLIALDKEAETFTMTCINHQRSYGADVISRIQAANEGKLKELQGCIQQDIFEMLRSMLTETGICVKQIKKVAIAGNTTMCHLLLGYSCEGLGRSPFKPVNISLTKITVQKLFEMIKANDEKKVFVDEWNAEVSILPGISAFIGADIVAGMYSCDMDLKEEPYLLLDIGTNGEMVIGNKEGFVAVSTAAGPVFEGGNISCGMPAVQGAIAHICENKCEVIGGVEPQGICGSGIVDLVAYLLCNKIIDENGTLTDAYFEDGYPVGDCVGNNQINVKLTQQDIRQLQMGKGAVRAGMEFLLQRMVPNGIYLAGGFGTAMDIKSACYIGLLPKESEKKVISVGNTVIEGLQKYLRDPNGEERVINIAKNVQEVLLAETGKFEESYIHFMQFLI